MQFTESYDVLQQEKYGEYFVGMNSGKGFIGTYGSIINEEILKRVYIIKGAAGTGKSTFMKQLYKMAAEQGIPAVRYACSSDPDSLDCIVLASKVAVLDGTAPHVYDMTYPGAVSGIIDVTKFWDEKLLAERRCEIIDLNKSKSKRFRDTYGKLSSLKILFDERQNCIGSVMRYDKMKGFIERFIKGADISPKGNAKGNVGQMKITRCVSTKGRLKLNTLEAAAEQIICVNDVYGSAYLFMKELAKALEERNISFTYSPDPLGIDVISDIFAEREKVLITVDENDECSKIINMNRFIDNDALRDRRGHMKLSKKCSDLLKDDVLRDLRAAGTFHYELERIYGSTMDFVAFRDFCLYNCEKILLGI